jgi:hypothetical protein
VHVHTWTDHARILGSFVNLSDMCQGST